MTTKEVTELLARHILEWEARGRREGIGRCREADALRLVVYELQNPQDTEELFFRREEGEKRAAEALRQELEYSAPPSSPVGSS